jgi:hypothetical protein
MIKQRGNTQKKSKMEENLTSTAAFPSIEFLQAVQEFLGRFPDFLTPEDLVTEVRTAIFELWLEHMEKL